MPTKTCPQCGRDFPLKPHGAHRRYCTDTCRAAAYRDRQAVKGNDTANQQALEEMLSDWVVPRSMAAVVATARCLAVAVDSQPQNAGLWARYQQAITQLLPVVAGDEDDEIAGVLAEIRAAGPPGW